MENLQERLIFIEKMFQDAWSSRIPKIYQYYEGRKTELLYAIQNNKLVDDDRKIYLLNRIKETSHPYWIGRFDEYQKYNKTF